MWGFNNALDRNLASKLFRKIMDPKIASKFNANLSSPKRQDQFFLSEYVYERIRSKSIVHDSYSCHILGGSPWPTQRVGNCFVGSPAGCNATTTDFYDCPIECRPKSHPDWKKC
jgi:hypothetical protein